MHISQKKVCLTLKICITQIENREDVVNLKKLFTLILVYILFSHFCSIYAYANEPKDDEEEDDNKKIIAIIDGKGYDAGEYSDRVLACTQILTYSEEIINDSRDKDKLIAEYNDRQQRISLSIGELSWEYEYDESGHLISEKSSQYGEVIYHYNQYDILYMVEYNGEFFRYWRDAKTNVVLGLLTMDREPVCKYEYGAHGETIGIYEFDEDNLIEHFEGENFIGCVNSIRYDNQYYISSENLFILFGKDYYDPKEDIRYVAQMGINYDKLGNDVSYYGDEEFPEQLINHEVLPSKIKLNPFRKRIILDRVIRKGKLYK